MNNEYLTVSELNGLIQNVIEAGFPQPLWICGEVQGYNRNRGKNHIFFELVEKDPDSKNIIAKIGLVLFQGRKAHINDILKKSENAFQLRDDIEVKFACTIDFYPPHGAVRLIIESIDPTYTLGRFAQEKQKLIELLTKKGVFEQNKRIELPDVPMTLGLITADDSAAYNDFLSELEKSGIGFKVLLRNTLMQGKKAESDVSRAIGDLAKIREIDAIVITRGGGSIADLSCFDSQKIAEKIAQCPKPVLSGIGHEINVSITDMAAHTFAKTPTAIAQFLVGRIEEYLDSLDKNLERILGGARDVLENEQRRLKDLAAGLLENTRGYLKDHREKIIYFQEAVRRHPNVILKAQRRLLDERRQILTKAARGALSAEHKRIGHIEKLIDIAHPVNTIRRGFSVTRDCKGRTVRSIREVKRGDRLMTEVADGVIAGDVVDTSKAKNR